MLLRMRSALLDPQLLTKLPRSNATLPDTVGQVDVSQMSGVDVSTTSRVPEKL